MTALKTRDDARKLFAETRGSLDSVSVADAMELWVLVEKELELHNAKGRLRMRLRPPNMFQIAKLRRDGWGGRMHLDFKVDGPYFDGRQGITLSEDYIGFAGWADSTNLKPFLNAFEAWCRK